MIAVVSAVHPWKVMHAAIIVTGPLVVPRPGGPLDSALSPQTGHPGPPQTPMMLRPVASEGREIALVRWLLPTATAPAGTGISISVGCNRPATNDLLGCPRR